MDKKQTRAKFYEDICRKLKQTKPWVKEVLSTHFENSFDPDLIPEYTKVLENENYLQMTKDRLLEKYSNHSIVQPDPCPCGAPAVPDVLWGWICTVGGTRHRNIERYATRRGISFEEALRFTDLVKEEQETRMNLELETDRKSVV